MLRIRSSTARLAILYVCSIVISVATLLGTAYLLTQRSLAREVDLVITTELDSLRDEFDDGGLDQLTEELNRRAEDWRRTSAVYLLVDKDGQRIAGNLSSWPALHGQSGPWVEFDIIATDEDPKIQHPVRAEIYSFGDMRLLVGTDVSERQRLVSQLRAATLWGIGLTALLTSLIGWWYSRRIAARVGKAALACESIISGDLRQRLPEDQSHDEFDQLAMAVNHVLDRIEQQTATVRTTFESAAHDLRAPLHRIRTRLEAALQGSQLSELGRLSMTATVTDLERIQRTLATLLQIAQAESAVQVTAGRRVDLAELARSIGELYGAEARERGLALSVTAPEAESVQGNDQLLAQLLANLLENAIKYVPRGGHISIEVGANNGRPLLLVRDDGPGIPAAARASVLLPFRRLDRDATVEGSGLGLSLVAALMRLHGGTVELADNNPGLVVRCEFPPAT